MDSEHRFYGELARWWPLISPLEDYAEEAAGFAEILHGAPMPVHTVLELGSGGGHNAFYLKADFALTLTDLSAEMLAVSHARNPECEHLQGDMRTLRLARDFDAVLVHDAIEYMTTADHLQKAIETAFVHCKPGGIALFVPDATTEDFVAGSDHGGSDADDGRGARYLEWTWDPDPNDSWVLTEYAFVLRSADGTVRVVHETHRTGLFCRNAWLQALRTAGFMASMLTEVTTEDRSPRQLFVGHRPITS